MVLGIVRWFTSTHVGKTFAAVVALPVFMVHPHARGEDFLLDFLYIVSNGSPPRTWGRLKEVTPSSTRRRFTPTHVGKTIHY